MLPFERLRSLVRWSGRDHLELAVEAADCLAEFGDDPALLEDEIRITVIHELAHHFGIDDDRLDQLGWA